MKPTKKPLQDVAVIGGGVAAMQATLALAALKHRVSLLCTDAALGGHSAAFPELYGYLDDDSRQAAAHLRDSMTKLTGQVAGNKAIKVHTETRLVAIHGEVGSFVIEADSPKAHQVFRAGAIVLAPGAGYAPATEAFGQKLAGAFTDMAGLTGLIRKGRPPKRIAILADSTAEQTRMVSAQVVSAAEILATRFGGAVTVLCHHVRVAATGLENLYRRARAAGVTVIKTTNARLRVGSGGKVAIEFDDPVAAATVAGEFDLVVVADLTPGRLDALTRGLIAGLRTGPDGALQYDNVWLLPTLTNRPGVFVAGGARGNSEWREAVIDGLAVAGQAHDLLTGGTIAPIKDAATVDADKCVLCLTCLRICPHGAIRIDDAKKAASVSPLSCRRCGICAAECPAVAIQLPGFSDDQMGARIAAKPRVTVFACENSALLAAETAGRKAGARVQLIKVPCAGKVDPRTILDALGRGADKVLVLGCHPENCQYLSGSSRASKRVERLGAALEKAGFDKSRVQFGGLASVEPARFVEYVS